MEANGIWPEEELGEGGFLVHGHLSNRVKMTIMIIKTVHGIAKLERYK